MRTDMKLIKLIKKKIKKLPPPYKKPNPPQKKNRKKTHSCYTMKSNITLTFVHNDAQMDLVLDRLYLLVIDTYIIVHIDCVQP